MSSGHIKQQTLAEASMEDLSAELLTRRLPFVPHVLEKESIVLFGVGRLSQNNTVHAGVFHRLLPAIDLTPVERPVYRDWLNGDVYQTVTAARDVEPLSDHEIAALRFAEDPAVLVADALHDAYSAQHPKGRNDIRLWEMANFGTGLVLTSIHRPHPDHLQAVVEMYNLSPPTIDPAA